MNTQTIISTIGIVIALLAIPAEAGKSRQKVIDFEDELIEGINKRPLNSLQKISDRDRKRNKPHLYRKRASFRTETARTLHELEFTSAAGGGTGAAVSNGSAQ